MQTAPPDKPWPTESLRLREPFEAGARHRHEVYPPTAAPKATRVYGRRREVAFLLVAALAALTALVAGAQSPAPPTAPASAPALNWVLPLFTDREGYRSMTLRGSAVKPSGANAISVTDLSITVFSGDAAARVDTILLSLDATFFPKENRAAGEKTVRVIRDEIEVTGEDWTYDHAGKIVSIRKNVRVVYRLPLKLTL